MDSEATDGNPTLYKYRDWGNCYHKSILTENQIYFASIDEINDPYDCKLPLRYDRMTDDELHSYHTSYHKQVYPEYTEAQIADEVAKVMSSWAHQDGEGIARVQEALRRERVGLFSTSRICDHSLMWSHYANSHTGFCVGFDRRRGLASVWKHNHVSPNQQKTIVLRQVEYSPKMPELIPFNFECGDHFVQPLDKKWDIWEYEMEERLVLMEQEQPLSKADRVLTLPPGIISEVILGCKISEDHEGEIVRVLQEKHDGVTLKRIVRDENEFKLRCKPVDLN